MNPTARAVLALIVLPTTVVGCYSRDEKPRGQGARGRPLAVLPKAEVDIERFYKYTPEQETAIKLLHRPYEDVAKPAAAAADQAAKALTDKVKGQWGSIRFVVPTEGKLVRYRATLATNIGDLVIDTFETFSPDVVRNFMARAKAGAFDGKSLTVENDTIVLGPPADKQAYTLPAHPVPEPLPKGCVFAFLNDGRAAGERFGIALRRVPGGASKVSMFGRMANASVDAALGEFADKLGKQPDSVVIKSARVEMFDTALFDGAQVRLPRLNKQGELDVPSLAVYTSVENPDVHPRDLPLDGRPTPTKAAAPAGPPREAATIPLTNPNLPPPNKEPPKTR